jgi:hypothetical protein
MKTVHSIMLRIVCHTFRTCTVPVTLLFLVVFDDLFSLLSLSLSSTSSSSLSSLLLDALSSDSLLSLSSLSVVFVEKCRRRSWINNTIGSQHAMLRSQRKHDSQQIRQWRTWWSNANTTHKRSGCESPGTSTCTCKNKNEHEIRIIPSRTNNKHEILTKANSTNNVQNRLKINYRTNHEQDRLKTNKTNETIKGGENKSKKTVRWADEHLPGYR